MSGIELLCIENGYHAPIIKQFKNFVILAQSDSDLEFKKMSIMRGDTRGFLTVENLLKHRK